MFPSALGHVTFLGKLVCRNVLELSSFLLIATSALQVLAGDLSYVGWQQARMCQAMSPVRTSFGRHMRVTAKHQGLQRVILAQF